MKTKKQDSPESIDEIREMFARYVVGGKRRDYNSLRFASPGVFQVVAAFLGKPVSPQEAGRVLELLKGFDHRHRALVVGCLLQLWNVFAPLDYRAAVSLLGRYRIEDSLTREKVIQFLQKEMGRSADRQVVRDTLDHLLKLHAE
jgi:hypothetical protein